MKAERRHELQTNSLAQFLENLPLYFRFHFGKVLLGALILVLLIVLVRQRMSSGRAGQQQAASALASVRRLIEELGYVDLSGQPADLRAAQRKLYASQVDGAVDEILTKTGDGPDDAPARAEALAARGDLYWIMGNLPELPGAATQPTLQMPRAPEQYLADAADVYNQVLRQHSDRTIPALTALFGLANIAENQGQWDVARTQYESIVARKDAPQVYKDMARQRAQLLPQLQEPVFTGNFGTPPPPPTTLPDTAAPARATQPAATPTTAPATQPR
jgi:hypothetical protein